MNQPKFDREQDVFDQMIGGSRGGRPNQGSLPAHVAAGVARSYQSVVTSNDAASVHLVELFGKEDAGNAGQLERMMWQGLILGEGAQQLFSVKAIVQYWLKQGYATQIGTTSPKSDPFGDEWPLLRVTDAGRDYINKNRIKK